MPWEYEPSPDNKHKRDWKEDVAGFVEQGGEVVGKCPLTISLDLATQLINCDARIEYSPARWPRAYPQRIYVIHERQLYRATPTTPGRSYHGFPEHPAKARDLPPQLKRQILELATSLKCAEQVAKCLKGR